MTTECNPILRVCLSLPTSSIEMPRWSRWSIPWSLQGRRIDDGSTSFTGSAVLGKHSWPLRMLGDFKWRHSLQSENLTVFSLTSASGTYSSKTLRTVHSAKTDHYPSTLRTIFFLDYSAQHWAAHFRELQIEVQSAMTQSMSSPFYHHFTVVFPIVFYFISGSSIDAVKN